MILFRNIFFLLFVCLSVYGQSTKAKVYPVAFYNLENLYHPESADELRDKEFSPTGSKKWTKEKYNKKLSNLSYAISQIAVEYGGVTILGVAEVGNRKVLEDLLNTKILKEKKYAVIHHDSPDRRGIDVGLIYNPFVYQVTKTTIYPFYLPSNPYYKTRDHLLVSGYLAGEPLHVIVNHWPSRYGARSGELREHAASIVKHITDSIQKSDPKAKMIIMGDLNDNPDDKSARLVLKAKKIAKEAKKNDLFNTMWELYDKGIGSIPYKGKWDLFDQIIISGNLLTDDKSSLRYWKAEVFKKDFLIQQEGKYKGYPWRTFSGNRFLNGFSDHLPTLIYLVK